MSTEIKVGWQYFGRDFHAADFANAYDIIEDDLSDEDIVSDEMSGAMSMDMFSGGMLDMYSNIEFTPMGNYHKDDPMNVYNHFDFWICHTNIKLKKSDYEKLMEVPGVEILYPYWTPYRFILAPAKMFDFRDVRLGVENALKANKSYLILDEEKEEYVDDNDPITSETFTLKDGDVETFSKQLNSFFKYWIMILGEGDFCTYYACNEDSLLDFKDVLESWSELSNSGSIFYSKGVKENEYYNKVCCNSN